MADYTAKELHKVMLKIFNSDKEGGYTSKELTEIFGRQRKNEILKYDPDVLMGFVRAHRDGAKITVGTIMKEKNRDVICVCTKVYDNGIHILKEDGTTEAWLNKYVTGSFEIVGRMNMQNVFENIRRFAEYTKTPFQPGDVIKTRDDVFGLFDYAQGIIKASVVRRDANQMKVVIMEHKNKNFIGRIYWLTNSDKNYEKV